MLTHSIPAIYRAATIVQNKHVEGIVPTFSHEQIRPIALQVLTQREKPPSCLLGCGSTHATAGTGRERRPGQWAGTATWNMIGGIPLQSAQTKTEHGKQETWLREREMRDWRREQVLSVCTWLSWFPLLLSICIACKKLQSCMVRFHIFSIISIN